MSLFEAYAASESAAPWSGDLLARFQDFLTRRVSPLSEKAQTALRRAVVSFTSHGTAATSVRQAARTLVSRLRRQPEEVSEEAVYFQRIREAAKDKTIENYSAYLISMDFG